MVEGVDEEGVRDERGAGGVGGEEEAVFLCVSQGLQWRGTHTHPGHTLPGALEALKQQRSW